MTDQQCTIEFLSEALVSVREEMKSLVSDLNLNEEAKEAIKVMQSGILAILDLVELDGDDLSGGGPPTSHFFAASPASTLSSPAPTATAKTTKREKNAAELRSKLKKVHRLANRGKTQEARAALAKIPNGKKLQSRSIEIAAKEMEDLLLQRGGLETVRWMLDLFFDWLIIRTAIGDHLKEKCQRYDREACAAMVESIKHFFTGTMATRGRRTDLNRNVFYAAAAAVIPKNALENRQIRAVMRLTGLRHDAVSKAIAFRMEMDDHKQGWRLLTTNTHEDSADYTLLDTWFHSSAASTEDNEMKKQVRVGLTESEGTISYHLHNRRYLSAKIPILHKEFLYSTEYEEMQRSFKHAQQHKRRTKAVRLLKQKGRQNPSDAEISCEEKRLGLVYQRKQAISLAKRCAYLFV